MLETYPEEDTSFDCWSNNGEPDGGTLSVKVALAFKTALMVSQIEKVSKERKVC